jgi:nucleotide-binding universal stress UspA family protein
MTMKTTLDKDLLNRSGTLMRQRSLFSATVLVPMLNLGVANDIIQLAAILAAGPRSARSAAPNGPASQGLKELSPQAKRGGVTAPAADPRVVVVGVVEVPADQPLTTGLVMARSYRALLDFLPSTVEVAGKQVRVDRVVKVSRDITSAVHQAAIDEQANLVLLHWKGYSRQPRRYTYGRVADGILEHPPCDVALVRPEGWRDSRKIFLPVRGGPSAERALTLALALAQHLGVPISVMHNVPGTGASSQRPLPGGGWQTLTTGTTGHRPVTTSVEARGEEPYIIFNQHLKAAEEGAGVPIERILTAGGDPAASLRAEVRQSDFVVMGTTPLSIEAQPWSSMPLKVSEEKGPPLMLVHAPRPLDMDGYRRKLRRPESTRRGKKQDVPKAWDDMPFEHWFVENTFHGDEFKDPEAFLEAKRRSGLSISVALLTSNDAAHIHSVITGLKKVLVEMHPIADQIAVIDAGSSDGTADIARSLGVEVYSCAELLPQKGNLHGRGESWWKSMAALRGDVLVWLDPRARRFHPSTAMSLAGPLLRVPTLQLVKAYGELQQDKKAESRKQKAESRKQELPHTAHGDYAPVDMSWGGFVMPGPETPQTAGRIRVQALKPDDLQALGAAQIAGMPPRTILQVLCPSLAAVIAPFSRDFAGRRGAMLSLPAFIGENLEAGLMLSVAAKYGAWAIAQVELRHAEPAPPPPPGLSNAIDILQVLARRLQDPAMRRRAAETAARLQRSLEGEAIRAFEDAMGPVFEVRALGPVERPPLLPIIGK